MTDITRYNPGSFCWTDLSVTDVKSALKFYQGVLGWEVKETPRGNGSLYYTFQIDGKDVCALYLMDEELKKKDITPYWRTYISVVNVEETLKNALQAGGTVLQPAFDVLDEGRMALIQDTQGSLFGVWEPKKHIGATVRDVAGSVCWRELMTSNLDSSGKFYARVFEWELSVDKSHGEPYSLFKQQNENIAGMIYPFLKDLKSSTWLTYWMVEDCKKSTQKALQLGGSVLSPVTKIQKMGNYSVLADPQKGLFALMDFKE